MMMVGEDRAEMTVRYERYLERGHFPEAAHLLRLLRADGSGVPGLVDHISEAFLASERIPFLIENRALREVCVAIDELKAKLPLYRAGDVSRWEGEVEAARRLDDEVRQAELIENYQLALEKYRCIKEIGWFRGVIVQHEQVTRARYHLQMAARAVAAVDDHPDPLAQVEEAERSMALASASAIAFLPEVLPELEGLRAELHQKRVAVYCRLLHEMVANEEFEEALTLAKTAIVRCPKVEAIRTYLPRLVPERVSGYRAAMAAARARADQCDYEGGLHEAMNAEQLFPESRPCAALVAELLQNRAAHEELVRQFHALESDYDRSWRARDYRVCVGIARQLRKLALSEPASVLMGTQVVERCTAAYSRYLRRARLRRAASLVTGEAVVIWAFRQMRGLIDR